MFKNLLYNIISDVSSFSTRSDTMERLIKEKLEDELNRYNNELSKIQSYLMSRDRIKVLRRMSYNMDKRSKENNDKSNQWYICINKY